MILSNVAIHRALDDRRLVIEPEPLPRDPSSSKGKSPPAVGSKSGCPHRCHEKRFRFVINARDLLTCVNIRWLSRPSTYLRIQENTCTACSFFGTLISSRSPVGWTPRRTT